MPALSPLRSVRFGPVVFGVVARTVPPAVGALSTLAVTPALVLAATDKHDFAVALTAASLLAGAGVGYAAHDPAAPTLASSPTTLAVRRGLRTAVTVAVLAAAWLTALLIAQRYGHGTPNAATLAAEMAASAALSAAFAGRARTDAPVASGPGAAAAALLVMLTIGALAYRWPALPTLGAGPTHHRWWWLATAGIVAAAWSSRDPGAPKRHSWTARRSKHPCVSTQDHRTVAPPSETCTHAVVKHDPRGCRTKVWRRPARVGNWGQPRSLPR